MSLINCRSGRAVQVVHNFNHRLERSTLVTEHKICHTNLKACERRIAELSNSINTSLPDHIFHEFKRRQSNAYNKSFRSIKRANLNKISNLKVDNDWHIKTKDNWIKNLTTTVIPKNISYFWHWVRSVAYLLLSMIFPSGISWLI